LAGDFVVKMIEKAITSASAKMLDHGHCSMMWQNAGKCGLDPWNFTLNPAGKAQVRANH
jgi:hypothetical protein